MSLSITPCLLAVKESGEEPVGSVVRLSSTFLQGNDSSLLWHWRNGFELLENPGSRRRMQRQISELRTG
jgi:hypothetical protein